MLSGIQIAARLTEIVGCRNPEKRLLPAVT
jgi:hypothetical protein